jgi:predicted Rossmann-fold nucleotide-binding protein
MPIVLMGRPFWAGLLNWFRERLVADGMIGAADLEPLPEERQVLLNL